MNATTKTAVFTMGLPGSGKSTVLARLHPELASTTIDPDTFKRSHPDYDPKNPSAVHDWSMEQAERAFGAAVTGDASFAVDGTGVNAERMIRRMNAARTAGFAIELLFVTVPVAVAIERNALRERSVAVSLIVDKARDIATSFSLVAPHADVVRAIENV